MTGAQLPEAQNQNLINPSRVSSTLPLWKQPSFYKLLALMVLGILAAFAAGYGYHSYLLGNISFWLVVAALAVFCAISALQMFLEKRSGTRALVIVFEVVALVIPFYDFSWRVLSAAGLVTFIFFFLGYWRSRSELAYSARIRFFRVTHGVVGYIVTGALIFAILFYVLVQGARGNVFVSESHFADFFGWTSGVSHQFYPDISVDGSFDDFAQSLVKAQLKGNDSFQAQDAVHQTQTIQQGVDQVIADISKSTGVTIGSSATTSDVLYQIILHTLHDWQGKFGQRFAVGWGVVLFLVLRSIGIVFAWVAQFLAMICYEILLASGFMKIVEHAETREVVEVP